MDHPISLPPKPEVSNAPRERRNTHSVGAGIRHEPFKGPASPPKTVIESLINLKLKAANTSTASALEILLALEGEAIECVDRLSLKHVAVNKPRALIDTGHIILLTRRDQNHVIEAISSQSSVEKNTPFVQWLNRQLRYAAKTYDLTQPLRFELNPQDGDISYPYTHALYAPFAPDPKRGGMLYTRASKWTEKDIPVPSRLAQIYGLQWAALGARKRARLSIAKKVWFSASALTLALLLCTPVPISTLAPAEIVADEPYVVSAPMDGVIANIYALPNTMVSMGQTLITLEDTNYRNALSIAKQEHSVSSAKLKRASLSALVDPKSKREIAIHKAERDLAQTRQNYAADRLSKTVITAPQSGLLIYSDMKDWMGRPVSTGQRIMEIADPNKMSLRLEAPILDSAVLNSGAKIRLFLDSDPLFGIDTTLQHASYYAQPQAGGGLAYEAYANLADVPVGTRIGARGVAKIYGDKAPLGYWLARRPLTALRQFFGL